MNLLAMFRRGAAALVVASTACLAPGARAADPVVPIEDFFRHPAMTGARLSPDGKRLGMMLVGASGRVVLGVADLAGNEKPRIVASLSQADVRSFRWVNERRLVFDIIDLSSASGEQYGAGLFAVNADGSGYRMLVQRLHVGVSEHTNVSSRVLEWNHRLHDTVRDGSDDVIVERGTFGAGNDLRSVALLRLNTSTGTVRALTTGAPDGALRWVVDAKGEPRAVVTADRGTGRTWWRDMATGTWTLLGESPIYDPSLSPLAVDGAGNFYVAARRGDPAGTEALYRYDVAQRKLDGEPLLALPGFDFDGALLFADKGERLIGARYDTDAEGTAWFDPAWQQVQERVDKLLPGTVNRLSCGDCSGAAPVLVRSHSDRQSAVFRLYDVKNGTLTPIGAERPWIDPKTMAQRSFVRIAARDGLELPVYVTQPRGKGPWPAVVLVHGGPYLRGGQWDWEADSQFLASRGYLVIEPEFRGSTGFGARHFRAGFKQWGLAMQDDLADAALWAVKQGLADRGRLCIAGASYGGYATLMGLVRHPDLYRCGVEWVGVTDIELMYTISWSDASLRWTRYGMPVLVGDPDKDAAQLAATSPLKQAAKIGRPLLMAYGGSDTRVPIEHGTRLRDAVTPHNKDVEWVQYPEEGHGFLLVKNRVDFWGRVEKFLARHLATPGAAAEASKTPGS